MSLIIRYEADPEVNNLYGYLKTRSRVRIMETTAAPLLHMTDQVSNNRTCSTDHSDMCHHVQTAKQKVARSRAEGGGLLSYVASKTLLSTGSIICCRISSSYEFKDFGR